MKPCPRQAELQSIVRRGHWPEACDPELRRHVETCRTCAEQLLVQHTFHAARAQAMHAARGHYPHLLHPNLLWWRAQLRRRNNALERVSRPITTAQVFAFCISILAAAALLRSQIGKAFNWSSWFPQSSFPQSSTTTHFDALSFFTSITTDWGLLLPLIGLGTVLLLSAVVVYLASDRS
ncbi:MAG TPA: hypothetical protein VNY74_14565 [Edaphobacter sp.]|jgi:hypothetical protein|nr:hypothetical protein [Edaphobacter sp.]